MKNFENAKELNELEQEKVAAGGMYGEPNPFTMRPKKVYTPEEPDNGITITSSDGWGEPRPAGITATWGEPEEGGATGTW